MTDEEWHIIADALLIASNYERKLGKPNDIKEAILKENLRDKILGSVLERSTEGT